MKINHRANLEANTLFALLGFCLLPLSKRKGYNKTVNNKQYCYVYSFTETVSYIFNISNTSPFDV